MEGYDVDVKNTIFIGQTMAFATENMNKGLVQRDIGNMNASLLLLIGIGLVLCISPLHNSTSNELQYFNRLVLDETSRRPICTCPFFSAEYADGKCYQEFTQGPCPFGQLMILDRTTGRGKCGCDQSNVSTFI